jgi:hypothetical protein
MKIYSPVTNNPRFMKIYELRNVLYISSFYTTVISVLWQIVSSSVAPLSGPTVKVRTPDTPQEGMASRSSSNPPYEEGIEIAQGGGEAPASVAEAVGMVSIT